MSKVSVIIPCLNASKYIKDTVNSVLNQTYTDFELIIVDGGSSDGTIEILENLQSKHQNIILICNVNDQGPAHSRLVGIKASKANFIAFLDADDLWYAQKLKIQVSKMVTENLDFTFTDYRIINDDGVVQPGVISGHNNNSYKQYLRRRGIANSTVIIRREIIGDVWDAYISNSHGEDTLWWLLLMKKREVSAHRVIECLCYYRISVNGRSRNIAKTQLSVFNSYHKNLKLGILASIYYCFLCVLNVSNRRLKCKFFPKK
jgi:teichuronic acid biosynthesis glycosyltransferase TuaG